MSALAKIRKAGFTVTLVDGFIEVSPSDKLNDIQRDYIRSNKAKIIALLMAELAANDSQFEPKPEIQANEYPKPITCYTPAGNPVSVMATDSKHEAQLKRWNPPKAKQ